MDAFLYPKVVAGLAVQYSKELAGVPFPRSTLFGMGWRRGTRESEPGLALFLAAAEALAQFLIEETLPAHAGSLSSKKARVGFAP